MKSKLKVIIPIIVILIIFLVGLFIMYKNSYKIELKNNEFVYELGEDISSDVSVYLKDADATKNIKEYKVSSDSLLIEGNKFILRESEFIPVGEYKVNVSYKKKDENFIVKVIDTKTPEFLNFKEVIELEENSENVDLTSYFEVKDLAKVNIAIEGEYDLAAPGEYKLKIIAEDENHNISTKEFILKITKKEIEQPKVPEKNTSPTPPVSSIKPSNNTSPSNNNNNNNVVDTSKYRKDISDAYVNQVNDYRRLKGLPELPVTEEAQVEADRRAKELCTYYSHDGVGSSFGEVIGEGSIGVDFITAWKNSPPHNATMLREQNVAIAASVYECNNYWYAVISFRMNY